MKATTILRAFDIASCRYADLRAYQRHYGTCDAREMWRTLQVIAACKRRLERICQEHDFSHQKFPNWECPTSPTFHCRYDDITDPAHDTCLHCGDPEERK